MTTTLKQAGGLDRAWYNQQITLARDAIAAANLQAVTNRIALGIETCITHPQDRARLSTRDYGVTGLHGGVTECVSGGLAAQGA